MIIDYLFLLRVMQFFVLYKRGVKMEKLFEFLITKVGYTAIVILAFLFPGMLFIFIWNRDIYCELEVFRLLILALAITLAIFIGNFLAVSCYSVIQIQAGDMEIDRPYMFGFPIFLTNLEIYFGLIYKLENPNFTIILFVNILLLFDFAILIFGSLPSLIKMLWRKIRKRK